MRYDWDGVRTRRLHAVKTGSFVAVVSFLVFVVPALIYA